MKYRFDETPTILDRNLGTYTLEYVRKDFVEIKHKPFPNEVCDYILSYKPSALQKLIYPLSPFGNKTFRLDWQRNGWSGLLTVFLRKTYYTAYI